MSANIKINNVIYGTTDSKDLIYNDTTVADELDDLNRLLDLIPDAMVLTQAEYDALGDIVQTDGKVYYIQDSGLDSVANNIEYNNSVTGITANNVQDAIDAAILNLNGLKFKKVSSLPTTVDTNTIYFIV